MTFRPHYGRVWLTFLRNSAVRELTFRGNFLIEVITRTFWFVSQIVLFEIIYSYVPTIENWTREQYFAFMATGMLINSLVETFFMPNCANFSELIRTGDLDFALAGWDGAAVQLFNVQQIETNSRRDNVDDRIDRSDLVKVDLFDR